MRLLLSETPRLFRSRSTAIVLDQVVSAGSNYLTALLMALALSRGDLGTAATLMSVTFLALGLSRATLSESLLMGGSSVSWRQTLQVFSSTVGACTLGVLTLVGLGIATMSEAAIGASAVPIVLAQDIGRAVLTGAGDIARVLWSDMVWLVTSTAIMAVMLVQGVREPGPYLMAWVAGASAALIPLARSAIVALSTRVDEETPLRGLGWANLAYEVSSVVANPAVVLVAGASALGDYRAASLAAVPLQFLTNASRPLVLSRGVNRGGGLSAAANAMSKWISVAGLVASLGVICLFLLGVLPGVVLSEVEPGWTLLSIVAFSFVSLLTQLYSLRARALGADSHYSLGKWVWALTSLPLAVLLGASAGAAGMAAGVLLGNMCQLTVLYRGRSGRN